MYPSIASDGAVGASLDAIPETRVLQNGGQIESSGLRSMDRGLSHTGSHRLGYMSWMEQLQRAIIEQGARMTYKTGRKLTAGSKCTSDRTMAPGVGALQL